MSVAEVAIAPAARRDVRAVRVLTSAVVVGGAILLLRSGPDLRAILGPVFVTAAVSLFYVQVLVARDGKLPVFEAATFFVGATAVYTIIPLLQFIAGGMMIGPWGDPRMYDLAVTPQEFGGFAWRHVTLLCSFVFPYLLVRGKRLYPLREVYRPGREMFGAVAFWSVFLTLIFASIEWYVGPTVSLYVGGTGAEYRQLPLIMRQALNVLSIVMFTIKQCLVVMLVSRWHRRTWKFVLFAWLAYEVLDTVWKMQGRTEAALLLLTAIVSYHRLVRPLRLGRAVLTAVLLLAAILLYGLMRDVGGVSSADRRAAWGSPTEFLVLYGTAYDIASRKALGILPPVPPQLYFSDFYRVVPSQLLPFYKWDPSDWYLVEVLEIRDGSIGLMFGMIAQAELGRAHVELAVRGLLLALFYAFVHRAYHRYSVSFWATIGYLFLLTWSYYAFRSTSFDILYRAVYYLLPTVLLVTVTTLLLGPLLRGKRPA